MNISGNAGDTFVVSGWAKGNAVPFNSDTEAPREFGIIATFHYTDGTTKDFTARFNTDVENWQYSAQPMVAEKAYSSITVTLAYDYNANTVCFDGIQLFKEAFGSSYTYDGDGNVVSVVDLQKQTTTYEFDANDNLTGVNLPTGAKLSYTYDNYHNVLTATTEEGVKYFFTYDTYGNNTSVSIGNKITSSAAYGNNGNTLLSTTDTMGKVTRYGYNANTNILEWVQYPEDTAATRTELTYSQTFTYNKVTGSLTSMTPGNGHTIRLEYDALQRLNKVDTGSLDRYYTYRDISNTQTTSQVTELRYGTDTETFFTYTYTYDSLGNIATYSDGTDTYTYTYDGKNQLVSQTGGPLDFTYTY